MRGLAEARRSRSPAGLAALLAVLILAGPAGATHVPDRRFLVVGYVIDRDGRPVVGARVVVTRVKTGLEYPARTETDGFYLVVVQLYDDAEGETLAIEAAGVRGAVRARFDVTDKRTERGTRADIRGDRLVENHAAFAETLRAFLAR
jgi:hypothetical protein